MSKPNPEDLGVIEALALFAAMGAALGEVGNVIGDYVLPEDGITAEAAMIRVMEAVDTQKLVAAMRGGNKFPPSLIVQARTMLKHAPPPEGADIEISGAWFKMAQNLARYCMTGAEPAEAGDDHIAPLAMPFNDEGPEKRGDRSDGGNSDRC